MIKNILCMHESQYFIKALANILLSYDLFSSGFTNRDDAYEFAAQFKNNIDLIIVSDKIGDKDSGFEMVSSMKKELGLGCPVIGLIGKLTEDVIDKARMEGVNLLLPSGVDEKSLMEHIRKFDSLWEANNPRSVILVDSQDYRLKKNLFELKGGNFSATGLSSAKNLVPTAIEERPDLIILSDEITDPDIFEAARGLKSDKRTLNIPVIVLSDNITADLKRKGVLSGIVDFYARTDKSGAFLWWVSDVINRLDENKFKTGIFFTAYPILAHIVKYHLAMEGYDIIDTANCSEARRMIRSSDIEFILCDISSHRKAFEFLKDVGECSRDDYMPVILIAGPSDYEELMKGLNGYAQDFVKTPFIPEELTLRVSNQIRMKETLEYVVNQNKNLKMLSIRDILTNTYNKNYLDSTLSSFISRYKRKNRIFSALMIDIEDFTKINSLFGELTADEVLKNVANVLEETLRPTDMIFRCGNDDFIVILEDTSEEFLKTVASRIINRMHNMVLSDENGHFHRVNLLVGALPYNGEKQDEFIRKLDAEMEKMKNVYEK